MNSMLDFLKTGKGKKKKKVTETTKQTSFLITSNH